MFSSFLILLAEVGQLSYRVGNPSLWVTCSVSNWWNDLKLRSSGSFSNVLFFVFSPRHTALWIWCHFMFLYFLFMYLVHSQTLTYFQVGVTTPNKQGEQFVWAPCQQAEETFLNLPSSYYLSYCLSVCFSLQSFSESKGKGPAHMLW